MSHVYKLYKAHYFKLLLLYFPVYCRLKHFSLLLVTSVLCYLVVHFSLSMACLGKTGFILFSLFVTPAALCMSDHSIKLCTFWKSNSQHHISIYMYFKNHTKLSVGKKQQNYMQLILTFLMHLTCFYGKKYNRKIKYNYNNNMIFIRLDY